jgi:predicted nucleic acid-binding protein
LIDTNILIYYFNGELAVRSLIDEIRRGDSAGFYCPITWVELLCYPGLSEIEANQMRQLFRELTCVTLTEIVLDCAAQIRRDYRLMLADALIGACALIEECTLVTRNINDFRRIDGLTLLNPFD